ncbi:MAG: IS5 family transposase [Epibacterium sp.]|nr:IS5 family transposase [Epibacterium sp.]NQX75431.1 IS5 family transposase [Epibacterium sp.]
MPGQLGFFDLEDRYAQLSKAGDPLEKLASVVDFEPFRYRLLKALKRSDGAKGGRPPYDPILMFKILILQALYGMSDDQAEFQIRDRLTFIRFLGLGPGDAVPDAKTIWLFREHLTRAGAVETLFARFDTLLRDKGYLAMSGQILDASLIPALRQHLDDGEKAAIKDGESAAEIWPDQPAKAAQKDVDARWTVKHSRAKPVAEGEKAKPDIAIPVFGYKNHIGIDRRYGLIRTWLVSDAAAHDGARLREGLVDSSNFASDVWADTAYRSGENERYLKAIGKVSRIHRKKPKGKPLPRRTARANAAKSAVRSRVEHVFAEQKARMKLVVRTIGIARARTKIGLANLAYNMKRLVWLQGSTAPA